MPEDKTGFDNYFDQRMSDPAFAEDYNQARAEIDATDRLVRDLEQVLDTRGISKAELARRIQANPASIRRLFTAEHGNPTMHTFVRVAAALGYRLALVSEEPTKDDRPTAL